MYSKSVLTIAICMIILSSCSSTTQVSSPTPLPPTATVLPTTQPTATLSPTNPPVATAIPTIPLAITPDATIPTSWDGLPIMPGILDGRPAGFSYVYAIRVQITEAEAYYQKQMIAEGWKLINRKTSETSIFGGPTVTLDFIRYGKKGYVMLIFSTKESYTMVMLTAEK